ncbi:hypothetical protein VTL71DRAFT_2045 [Oculimacula yallundae]|uniref:Threonine/serine exporter-like N-terminal domain-containing protein n=1 Tax=Oculimacula yallundae TaxID=86028 RepID=A0ABR4C9P7_9HELO
MDRMSQSLGKAQSRPLQDNMDENEHQAIKSNQEAFQNKRLQTPNYVSAPPTPWGMEQRGADIPTPDSPVLRQVTSNYPGNPPKLPRWAQGDREKSEEAMDYDGEQMAMSRPPLSRSQSFYKARSTMGPNDMGGPPLPQPQTFTINVTPGPSGPSISISNNGSPNGQNEEYPQTPTEAKDRFGSNSSTLRGAGEEFTPASNYFRLADPPMTRPTLPSRTHTTKKSYSVREVDLDQQSYAGDRARRATMGKPFPNAQQFQFNTSTATPMQFSQKKYSMMDNKAMAIEYPEEEDLKGYEMTSREVGSKEDRYEYLLRLGRALILFGAPPHRLEDYLVEASQALGIRGYFLYAAGIMVCSFDDISNGADGGFLEAKADVRIIREREAVDMDKLDDLRLIFKAVKLDQMTCTDGTNKINQLFARAPQNNVVVMIVAYGFASVCVGTFAFESRPIDLPIQFLFGMLTGVLHVIVTRYLPFAIVFEVLCPMIMSFLARGVGSINGGRIFCFSAIAQAAIVLILPGYVMMMAMLELQSKKVASGAIRAAQAFLYTMFLALGMAVGAALYGTIDRNAVNSTRCAGAMDLPVYYRFIGATCFSLALSTTMQIKWRECPFAVVFALLGFAVNYLGSLAFPRTPQIFNVIASFVIGVCGNLYARVGRGLAVGIIMPALTIQVPSALSASAALLAGLDDANVIHNITDTFTNNGGFHNGTSQVDKTYHPNIDQVVYTVGMSITELAIAITIGLFLANMAVYPMGVKRRGGVFGH